MKWLCTDCSAINASGAPKCHNCGVEANSVMKFTVSDSTASNQPPDKFPPRVFLFKPDIEHAFKAFRVWTGANLKPNSDLDIEYLSLAEFEAAMAEKDEEIAKFRDLYRAKSNQVIRFGKHNGTLEQKLSAAEALLGEAETALETIANVSYRNEYKDGKFIRALYAEDFAQEALTKLRERKK